jgi:CRISPR-associated protein Cas5t
MVIHIVPEEEEDFEIVYHSLKYPKKYLSLGRYEDILDVERVDIVNLSEKKVAETTMDVYIPVDSKVKVGKRDATIYTLTKEYDDKTAHQGIRRWKEKIKVMYFPIETTVRNVYMDDFREGSSVVVLA